MLPENKQNHWFDGDSMVHAIRIKNGEMYYCNRYLETPRYIEEKAAGKATRLRIGEMMHKGGIFKVLFGTLKNKIGLTNVEDLKAANANTAFAHHQKQTYALVEGDLPFRIKVNNSNDFDITSIGHDDFNGQLKHNVSAHPKVNRKSGEFMTFGYGLGKPHVNYTRFDKNRKMLNTLTVPITSPKMIHDFLATENYAIIPDLPIEFNAEVALKEGGSVFKYNPNVPARYGVMKKENTNPNAVQWFDLPNHYVFHFVNAWEETND